MTNRSSYRPALLLFLFPAVILSTGTTTTADSSAGNMTSPMQRSEQDALYSVIQSFVGKWWDGRQLYPDPCGWTAIQGVSCDLFDGLWYVTSLSLGPLLENSLDCAADAGFSTEVFRLKHLRSLSLYSCFASRLHHPVTLPSPARPGGWDSFAGSLETLEFRWNRGLVGPVPPDIGRLKNLQSLVLVENGLSGLLPPELGGLVRLRRLVLSGNNFTGPVPATLGRNLSQLLILDASRNSLSGPLPASLGGLTSLLKLDLSGNTIEGPLPLEMGGLRSLTLLDLRNNRLSGGLPPVASLRGMRSLQVMLLSDNPTLGGGLADEEGSLSNLTTLDLSNTGLVGSIPESLGSMTRLRFLALSDNRLDGRVPTKLAEIPSLGALYLNGNNLTGALEFSGAFYERVGRRFAVWGNPNLCYHPDAGAAAAPVGVNRCSDAGSDNPRSGGASGASSRVDGQSGEVSDAGSGPVSGWIRLVCGVVTGAVLGLWWIS